MKVVQAKPKLAKVLKEKGITQTQLAELTGINQASISRFDRNTQRKDDHLFTISHALGLKAEDLFELTIIEED